MTSDVAPTVGETIVLLRRRRKMSRRNLAAATGISYDRLANIETGRSRVYADELPALARELGCEMADLVPDTAEVPMR
jgi:transcriptional regulator with XRE-family HTH domain